ncbi:glucose-6-phosphate dehydrogenase assembly protein OpcA [Streptomyces sp. Z26]|uniref:glucose-6-phosphate dehydrogenase assembly protein OpcA n=1 Tax=Streptomyces sp. Z26 TaxID=2500177 RepID=UPI000EF131B7|nr:glucose-6-phosphate dehydrogenase assembly protein OpcA [Streptomyces sp. Z26]RLL66268.1 glucose-6-phosphate dehydrogenase assembly protein OpcA [Streptomyces sp. Z26]
MNIDLTDTTSGQINSALVKARRASGSPAVGMVLTLVIVTDEGNHYDALKAAGEASKEHPSRILVVVRRPGRSPRDRAKARLDAEVRAGDGSAAGETVLLRLHGELAAHAYSVVLPLLLPDAPVVVWWPEDAPEHPSEDLLGTLAQRRITDAAATEDPEGSLRVRAETYAPGDTDLAWTRITPWRSVLAAALDQKHTEISGATVEGEEYNPSSALLALWLAERLDVPVTRVITDGPGITAVRLDAADGEICLDRADGSLAELAVPGQPDRHVALQRRTTAELVAEELRRLDPDEAYERAVRFHGGAADTLAGDVRPGDGAKPDGGAGAGGAASDAAADCDAAGNAKPDDAASDAGGASGAAATSGGKGAGAKKTAAKAGGRKAAAGTDGAAGS